MNRVARVATYIGLLAIALLAGCASFDPSVVRSKTEGKAILVASNIGSSLSLLWIGTTVFNNEYGEHSVPDTRLDQAALGTASWALLSDKRFRSVEAVENVVRGKDGFPDKLKAKADFLLLIELSTGPDLVFRTNQHMSGVGVLQRSILGTTPRAVMFASLKGEVFDLRSGKSLGTQSYTDIMDMATLLESGPKIPTSAVGQTLESATTRTQAAVINLVRVLGL